MPISTAFDGPIVARILIAAVSLVFLKSREFAALATTKVEPR